MKERLLDFDNISNEITLFENPFTFDVNVAFADIQLEKHSMKKHWCVSGNKGSNSFFRLGLYRNLLSPEYSNDSESSQSNKNPIENESSTDRTSVSEEPSESSNGNEAERDNNVLLQKGAEPKDTLIAIENNELLLRKEKRNANDERIEKNKINNEEILEIIDFEKDFEIEGELSSLHDNNTNNVNSIIIKRKSDFVENNENKISNSQNFLPFKKRYIKKIARKKKLTASKNSNRTKRINRPVFETSPHGNQNLINSCLDRPIEIEILSQAQVHEISSTQISPPHNDINLQSHPAQQLEQSHELGDVSEQINHITNVQENEPEESEQETVPREQYENLTVDLYYDSAFTDVELLAENIVKKQITEDLSRERKRKQFQPRKQQEKIISTESSSAASSSSSSISSISSFNNMSKSGHRSNKNKNSRKKNSKTDINNVQGEQFFRSQAGTNENADDEFRTGLAETTETESNSSKKLFRPLLEKKKKGISKANEAIDETNEKNEIKKVDFHNLFTGYFDTHPFGRQERLEPLKDRKKKEIDEMNSKADSFETYRRNLCSHDCSEKVIQCDNVTSSNLNEREIENMLGISHNTGDLFGDCNKSTSMVNSPTKIIVEDAKSKKMELPMKKFRIRVNKNFSKILQADTIPKERSFSIESKQKGTKLVKEENECQINNISENREIYTIKKSPCKFLHAEKENILGISYNRKDLIVNCNKSKIQSPTKMINKDGKPKNLKPEIKELRIKVDRNLSKILKERSCNRKLEQKEKDLMEHEYKREIIKTSEKQEICNTRKDAPRKFFQNSEKSPFEKKFYTKSKSVKKKGNVQTSGKQSKSSSIFDFTASQSSPSNSDDPTKDVIKDLIKAGRVEVVKYKKGSGKLKTKFKKPKLCKKQICEDGSKRAVTNPAQNTNNIAKEVDFEAFKNANNNDNGFDNDIFMSEEVSRNNTNSLNGLARRGIKNRATQNPYSRLIVNSRKVKDKKVLLALAKSFIRRSEEMNKNQSVLTKTKKLSSNDQIGSASPWRVEEDLPSLFNFSRNSENLPSFSSDVINPPSPQQNKNQVLRSSRNFSLNKSLDNSNIENIQPAFENSNLNIETNPKKGKIHRSPLKQINIIDIINLPLLSNNNSTPIHRPAVFNPFSPLEYNSQNALFKKPTTELKNPTAGEEITSLFGFDRDIEEESAENIETVSLDLKNSKKNLHKKLKKLKRLVPNNNLREVNEVSKPTRLFNIKTIRPIFEDTTKTFQQKNIPQMLSYTKSKTGKKYDEKNYDPVDLNISSEESGKEIQNKNIENEPTLFEIENIPLQASNSIRTYERSKRKRPKTRHNFVLYNDTDSDKESDAEQPKKKKKKHRNEPKQNEELKSFYNDFNNMCAEIEKYNLVVE
ncbi:uncharacterized protein MAL13P1.304-like [Condylostylus longicornis]|uniref:uncharacterized protein MAL13P1.304-like n=1 Tax=Condylostylus longicornis TaxID=2530218 RepID=UPI00244DA336|nr:uncharacterized protein MAL13P1.304-like [Condylostylus longicornis]